MYDVIIVGSGHAAVEAAWSLLHKKAKVMMISFSKNDIANLPCNVSIGGSAKGILVKELFALGALMPIAADETQLQTKMLNNSKGAAVHAMRAQVDKIEYPKFISKKLLTSPMDFLEQEVTGLLIKNNSVNGVKLSNGKTIKSKSVIMTTGTFLNSKTMKGKEIIKEGPDQKKSAIDLEKDIVNNIPTLRLKTGTPPRIIKDSINFSKLDVEPGSKTPLYFTEGEKIKKKYQNVNSWLGFTTKKSHEVIVNNMDKSYLFSEEIVGSGPRYCPSIEDKIRKFSDKERHQIFFELESEKMDTVYLAGLSSSMPKEVQENFIHNIKGLEKAVFSKYAYAIEYTAIDSTSLKQTLESKIINNLYFAGQINGTSGYEEAAAQGLIAGINSINKIKKKEPLILTRNQSYIGVMIDDITSKKILDPYRLLTSRAEYRLLLRNDNATKRLYEISYKNGLISKAKYMYFKKRFDNQQTFTDFLKKTTLTPAQVNQNFKNKKINLYGSISLYEMLKRPEFEINDLKNYTKKIIDTLKISDFDLTTVSNEIKFEGYILKQQREIEKYLKYQKYNIPEKIKYSKVLNLSKEAVEKFEKYSPQNLHQATNIQGIKPSDIMTLIHYLNTIKNEK